MPLLLNELHAAARPTVLVLDDLHAIEDAEALRSLATFVERAPRGLHVAVTTRRDPPLGLPRLRARGELVELRAPDLRFWTPRRRRCSRRSGRTSARSSWPTWRRARRAGGRAAAGRAVAARPPARCAEGGTGMAHIADYLGEEVLDGQPPEVRSFLLRSSVLERLGGELCDTVLETSGSAERLEALDTAGLFLIPLDPAGRWYRYHHLFRDTLARRLEVEQPGADTALHLRASTWFAEHDAPADAIRHALAGGRGGDLVAEHWRATFNRGELATVSHWLAALPPSVVEADPQPVARAGVDRPRHRPPRRAPAMLDAAERGAPPTTARGRRCCARSTRSNRGDLGAAAAASRGHGRRRARTTGSGARSPRSSRAPSPIGAARTPSASCRTHCAPRAPTATAWQSCTRSAT